MIGVILGYNEIAIFVGRVDSGHAFLFYPYLTELPDIGRRGCFFKGCDEFIPRGIVEQVPLQIILQACLHLRGSHYLFKHPQHHRCLVVDDIVIEQSGIAHVCQSLSDGVGTFCTVNGDCRCLVGFEEIQVVVDICERSPDYLRGHEIGHHLLCPDILKPLQRHKVAKPEMGCLMGNELHARHFLFLRGISFQKDAAVVHLDGSWVLHATELITG